MQISTLTRSLSFVIQKSSLFGLVAYAYLGTIFLLEKRILR